MAMRSVHPLALVMLAVVMPSSGCGRIRYDDAIASDASHSEAGRVDSTSPKDSGRDGGRASWKADGRADTSAEDSGRESAATPDAGVDGASIDAFTDAARSDARPDARADAEADADAGAPESANCTVMTTVGPVIVDAATISGRWWKRDGLIIFENGSPAGYSEYVTRLVYVNHVVSQQNYQNWWWSWTGGTWVLESDRDGVPRERRRRRGENHNDGGEVEAGVVVEPDSDAVLGPLGSPPARTAHSGPPKAPRARSGGSQSRAPSPSSSCRRRTRIRARSRRGLTGPCGSPKGAGTRSGASRPLAP